MKLNALAQILQIASPQETKAIIKLISIDIISSLGGDKYLIQANQNKLVATSNQSITPNEKYWATLKSDNNTIIVSNLIKYPHMLKNIQNLPNILSLVDLKSILNEKNPLSNLKDLLLQSASQATSKHEFIQISNLLLPFIQNIITIPLQYRKNFGVFQLKKRYNKKNKKLQIDFYAAFHNLGPISGLISSLNDDIVINLDVAFLSTKLFLEQHLKDMKYKINIRIKQNIVALHDITSNSILDLNA